MRFIGSVIDKLQRHPKRIVFPEGHEPRVLQAARQYYSLRLGAPILLGDRTRIKEIAAALNISLEGIRIINPAESEEIIQLILDIKKKTGHLKYKNRLLKDFRFQTSKNFPSRSLRPGMLTLTEKIEGKKDRHALVFGKSFTVRWKLSTVPKQQTNVPALILARKDLLSVYFAVENGALAYVVR